MDKLPIKTTKQYPLQLGIRCERWVRKATTELRAKHNVSVPKLLRDIVHTGLKDALKQARSEK